MKRKRGEVIRDFSNQAINIDDWINIEKPNEILANFPTLSNEADFSIIYHSNSLPGPKILNKSLFADKDYQTGELVVYSGINYGQKGRWIKNDLLNANMKEEEEGCFVNVRNVKYGEELVAFKIDKARMKCILDEMGFGVSLNVLYKALLVQIEDNIKNGLILNDLDTMPRLVSSKFWKRFWNEEICLHCKLDIFVVENNFCGKRCRRLYKKLK